MSKSRLTNKAKQRGDIMLDALIGMLLLTIIGLGIVYVTSRVSVSQKDMNVHNLVVSNLRADLQTGNSTNAPPLVVGDDSFTIKRHNDDITVRIGDKDVNITMHALSATKKSDGTYKVCVGAISCND